MTTDHRLNAKAQVDALIAMLNADPGRDQLQPVVEECEALSRAIAAFHIEGIRFRMFNVDRLLNLGGVPVPAGAAPLVRRRSSRARGRGFPHPFASGPANRVTTRALTAERRRRTKT